MKGKALLVVLGIVLLSTYLAATSLAQEHSYVGVDRCKICHRGAKKGRQYEIWLESKHAQAFKTLQSEAARKIAQEKGLTQPPDQAPECLKCHTTGYGADPSRFGPKFDKTMGVQCEACHGPGSEYRKKSIMEDWDKAVAAGMNPIRVADGSAEKWCRRCHNEESPTFKGFNFDEYWAKIKHPRPKQ